MAGYISSPAVAAAAAAVLVTPRGTSSSQCLSFIGKFQALPTRRLSSFRFCSVSSSAMTPGPAPAVKKKRKRYRKLYPGESEGITEEMRFVAMRLRNINGKYVHRLNRSSGGSGSGCESSGSDGETRDSGSFAGEGEDEESGGAEDEAEEDDVMWIPSVEGFVKYLVDSKLVFHTIERIVDESSDVAYAYFRKTGLERSGSLSKDLEWFSKQNVEIPTPSNPGVTYSKYLEELAERSAPLFLSHFYNIYFSHIAGGQVIVNQVSDKSFQGRQLEFCRWEGDVLCSFKGVREKLNMLGEHWSRDDKNKCLKETTKSFRFMGQITRLIIL